ncbi:hypothetical protein B0F90DRAFT_1824042 [Multifurca ochricompacta]|uniref:Uncharacterized protein n=1 Tax=Multifurca ochricompacta TaxID=376703 RepID=A0AAD4LUL4_9AGAM|nr:hypothetical protein B0F90DRAFT_1824042 [Multifurca ochricompacta]
MNNQPRLFTHWIPRLQYDRKFYQTLSEESLSILLEQPTRSRLQFVDAYLEDARRDEGKVYTFVPLTVPRSGPTSAPIHKSPALTPVDDDEGDSEERVALVARPKPRHPHNLYLPLFLPAPSPISTPHQIRDPTPPTSSYSSAKWSLIETLAEELLLYSSSGLSPRNIASKDGQDIPDSDYEDVDFNSDDES